MKTQSDWINVVVGSSLALALAVVLSVPAPARAADQPKGAQKLTQLQPIKSVQDVQNIRPGDMIVMSCPKCKTVTVSYADKDVKGGAALGTDAKPTKLAAQHLCPGCQNAFEYKGHGKAKHEVVVHKCEKCGSKDAFCCVMKKDATATQGMEHSK